MTTVIQVFIMKGGVLEGTELVSGERFVIGRDPSAGLQLEDMSVGPRHLGVFVHDGRLAIQDLGTPGGTRVNGEAISGARYVGPREDIVVGAYTLKLKLMPQAQASAPPAAAAAAPAPVPVATSPSAALRGVVVGDTRLVQEEATVLTAAPIGPASDPNHPVGDGAATVVSPHRGGIGTATGTPTAVSPPVSPVPRAAPQPQPQPQPLPQPLPQPAPQPPRQPLPTPQQAPLAAAGGAAAALAEVTAPDRSEVDLPAFALPDAPAGDEQAPAFQPFFDDDEHDDEDEPWSLVQHLVRPPQGAAGAQAVVEVIHHRRDRVVQHVVLPVGGKFVLGSNWSKAERLERGLNKPLTLVKLKKDGVAEILAHDGVQGRVLRQGQQQELGAGPAPLVDGELASLVIGEERIFVRFAGKAKLLWTAEDIADARANRRLTMVSGFAAALFFGFFAFASWVYGFRSKSEAVIDLGDDGFAEVVKQIEFEPPPEPEKKPPPPPVKTAEPVPQKEAPVKTASAKPEPKNQPPTPAEPAPKPGVMDLLNNIPKVNDNASNQNLHAALSNVKGVRVPGEVGGFKTSALVGKGPSSGVQIGGAAGGVSTSGINSLIRKDGAAGSLGGKGDRAVAGKVTTQPRLTETRGNGELSKDEIQRVINAHVGEIQFCYEKQLRSQPGLSGRVVLEWEVSVSGAVTKVGVQTSQLASPAAVSCMQDKIKRWKFPKPRGSGSVTVVYPFVFNVM